MNDAVELLRVGRVWRPHGVRGECKIIPEGDDPEQLTELTVLFLGKTADEATPYEITSARMQHAKRGPLLLYMLEGVEGRDEATMLRGLGAYADASELPEPEAGEVYIDDIIGLEVVDDQGEPIGTLSDVVQTTAHDVYVVAREDGQEVMIPAVEEFIKEIDLDAGRLVVTPIEGLLE